MSLFLIDWMFIIWYMVLALGIGFYYSKRASRSILDFFLSGRTLPWWLLGTSMVATTFAADTPLAVTGIVIKDGISGNWFWWTFLFGGSLTVFFFAHLWRRAEVLTEVEFIAIRYSGTPAKLLRGFKALYLGIPVSSIIFGWVTLAMVRIIQTIFNVSDIKALLICLAITISYTTLSGLWGVVTTDVLQFSMAMVGAVVLAVVSIEKVGGMSSFLSSLHSLSATTGKDYVSIFPSFGEALPLAFFVALFVQWWAVYYPGAEPGGGGWVAQRMLAARDPRHSAAGTLWFNIAHYVLRPWPWILTALAALILFPELSSAASGDMEAAYPKMIALLPAGIRGVMIASFLAAYMSTIDSILTLSASYLVNDFYRPFLKPDSQERHYVLVSRAAVIVVALSGAAFTFLLGSVKMGWALIMELSGGIGLVLLLRWYWWRINAWSEISALAASGSMAVYLKLFPGSFLPASLSSLLRRAGFEVGEWGVNIILIVSFTTLVWAVVTLLTPPDREDRLISFYTKVRPGGFWTPIASKAGISEKLKLHPFLGWLLSVLVILFFLLGIGKLVFMSWGQALIFITAGIIASFFLFKVLNEIKW
ncbi:MAG: sodium:solute symporter family protein [Candidatus Aminicenantales bacterium]